MLVGSDILPQVDEMPPEEDPAGITYDSYRVRLLSKCAAQAPFTFLQPVAILTASAKLWSKCCRKLSAFETDRHPAHLGRRCRSARLLAGVRQSAQMAVRRSMMRRGVPPVLAAGYLREARCSDMCLEHPDWTTGHIRAGVGLMLSNRGSLLVCHASGLICLAATSRRCIQNLRKPTRECVISLRGLSFLRRQRALRGAQVDNMYNPSCLCSRLGKDPEGITWEEHQEALKAQAAANFKMCSRLQAHASPRPRDWRRVMLGAGGRCRDHSGLGGARRFPKRSSVRCHGALVWPSFLIWNSFLCRKRQG